MAEDQKPDGSQLSGALIGWERQRSRHGMILTVQLVENAAQYQDHQYHRVTMALNDRQLRSLARDLARAAQARGLDLRSQLPWRRRMWDRIKALMG